MNFKIIAVDFDGTLCVNNWPDIGEPNIALIEWLKQESLIGNKLILWTCRTDEMLKQAEVWCADHGLYFDAINVNIPESIELFGSDCRKVFADIYIDDKALSICAEDWKIIKGEKYE